VYCYFRLVEQVLCDGVCGLACMVRVSDHSEISAVFAPEEVAHALASENVPACGSPSHMGDVALVPGRAAATVL
jgi:hypothetical protein